MNDSVHVHVHVSKNTTHTLINYLHGDNVWSSSVGKGDPVWYIHAVVTVGPHKGVRMGQSKRTWTLPPLGGELRRLQKWNWHQIRRKIVIQRERTDAKRDRKLPNIVLWNRLHNIFCTCRLCLMMLQSNTNEVNFNISPAECVGSSEHCLGTVNRYTAKERQKYHAPNDTQFAEQINYFTQNKNTSTTKINLRSLPTSDSRWFLMISPSSKWPDITAT